MSRPLLQQCHELAGDDQVKHTFQIRMGFCHRPYLAGRCVLIRVLA